MLIQRKWLQICKNSTVTTDIHNTGMSTTVHYDHV